MNKTYSNVNRATFTCLGAKLSAQGLSLDRDAGYLSKNGISLNYKFDEQAQTLIVENLEVVFPASLAGMNNEKVMGILDKAIVDCQS